MSNIQKLDWMDIARIRRIIEDLENSIESENMDIITFDAEVARRFNFPKTPN